MNGLADIGRRELRAVSSYGFYDDPSRLLRLVRFQVRLGFQIEERTRMQVANAREAEVDKLIPPRALGEELKRIADEDSPAEIMKGLEEAGLTALFLPVSGGTKFNLPGVAKLEKLVKLLPDESRARASRFGPFLYALAEKLTPREKQALTKAAALDKEDLDQWQKLEARSKKIETALRSPRIRKPSQVYHIVSTAPPGEILFVMYHSPLKPVQERLKSYFQKYLPLLQEITPEEWAVVEAKAGTPRYQKAREEFIAARLDRRPPRPKEPESTDTTPPPPATPPAEPLLARKGK